jgi:uncharacterized protein YceK
MLGRETMDKLILKFILVVTIILMLSGCAGFGNYTDSTNYDDGFYHWGQGKSDWIHRY